MHVRFASGLVEIHLPFFNFSVKEGKQAFQKTILDRGEIRMEVINMGMSDPDEVITAGILGRSADDLLDGLGRPQRGRIAGVSTGFSGSPAGRLYSGFVGSPLRGASSIVIFAGAGAAPWWRPL
jgi:hypothetical protein